MYVCIYMYSTVPKHFVCSSDAILRVVQERFSVDGLGLGLAVLVGLGRVVVGAAWTKSLILTRWSS